MLFYNKYYISVQDLCMYNNKNHKLSQKSVNEGLVNLSDYFQGIGRKTLETTQAMTILGENGYKDIPSFLRGLQGGESNAMTAGKALLETGYNIASTLLPFYAGDVAVTKLLNKTNPRINPKTLQKLPFEPPVKGSPGLLKSMGLGIAGTYGAEGVMSVLENLKGDLAIYKDYLGDYNKDLNAILELYPKNQDIKILVDLMKRKGFEGLQKLEAAKTKAANSNKRYKIAIKGEANIGSYLHNFLSGAAGGAAATKSWQGALVSGLGDMAYDIGKDVYHNTQDADYKATAYAAELAEKAESMANQLDKYDRSFADQLRNSSMQFEAWFRKNIYKVSKNKWNPDAWRDYLQKNVFNKKDELEEVADTYQMDEYLRLKKINKDI